MHNQVICIWIHSYRTEPMERKQQDQIATKNNLIRDVFHINMHIRKLIFTI